jgi:hypothetical protein
VISAIAACQLAARAGSGPSAPDDGLLPARAAEAPAISRTCSSSHYMCRTLNPSPSPSLSLDDRAAPDSALGACYASDEAELTIAAIAGDIQNRA